jgi:HAD superfamily hydrolase (TIGR01509 family)
MNDVSNRFGIVFDMDGVLIDSNPYHKKALKSFAKKYGYNLNEKELRERIYGRQNKEWIPNLFNREMSADEIEKYAQEKELNFQKIFDKDIAPVNGLIPFLRSLRDLSIPRAIATSAPQMNVDFVFRKTEIGDFFGLVLNDSHVKRGKPDPEIYLKASELLGFEPPECVVFEDSLSGVESARRANCKVIAVATTHSAEEFGKVDLVIDDFTQVSLEAVNNIFN